VVRRGLRSALAAVGVSVAMVLLAPAAAPAAPDDGAFPGAPSTDPAEQSATNAPVTRQVRTCRLYAGNGAYGMTCRGGTGDSATYAEILGGEKPPRCWHEPVPEDFEVPRYTPEQLDEKGDPLPGRWWLLTCLIAGLDFDTLAPQGDMEFSQEPEYLLAPTPPTRLTENQSLLLAGQRSTRQIPEPFAATSPSATPRVRQDIAFFVPPSQRTGETISVSGPGLGTVQMRARMTELVVHPTGVRPEPRVTCPGGGVQVGIGQSRAEVPQACWWQWDRSSAHRSRERYPVEVEARWVVEYEAGEGWTRLGAFTREQTITQVVTEVQTIVVP